MRVALLLTLLLHAQISWAQGDMREEFSRARVDRILSEETETVAGFERTTQQVLPHILDLPDSEESIPYENHILPGRPDMRMHEGEMIVIQKITELNGSTQYIVQEKYRLSGILWLCAFFIGLSVLLGRRMGLLSLVGLAVSILVLVLFVIPRIAAGDDPLTISIVGSAVIACSSLYLAHGFKRRTSVALLATLLTLALAAVIAVIFVHVSKLFGMGTEETMFLQMGNIANLDFRGLLLGGMIIGCLGVLDDITTAQSAAVEEISKANPRMTIMDLRRAGFSVGREHIASLINTLALAYAGASLPLLLLFKTQETYPLWVTLNSEFLAEEIVRTLVGSTALLLAVPISTLLAVKFLKVPTGSSPEAKSSFHVH